MKHFCTWNVSDLFARERTWSDKEDRLLCLQLVMSSVQFCSSKGNRWKFGEQNATIVMLKQIPLYRHYCNHNPKIIWTECCITPCHWDKCASWHLRCQFRAFSPSLRFGTMYPVAKLAYLQEILSFNAILVNNNNNKSISKNFYNSQSGIIFTLQCLFAYWLEGTLM